MQININSYFSGAGLLDLGLLNAGMNVQRSYEIDPVACQTQINNGLNVTECDLTKKLVGDDSLAEIHAYTYPCTK